MQETILISLPLPQLQTLIIDCVNACFDVRSDDNASPKTEIIGRSELCNRLSITEPTAIRWEKKGKIPCFRVGSNVRYNWQTVIESLEGKTKGGTNR